MKIGGQKPTLEEGCVVPARFGKSRLDSETLIIVVIGGVVQHKGRFLFLLYRRFILLLFPDPALILVTRLDIFLSLPSGLLLISNSFQLLPYLLHEVSGWLLVIGGCVRG